MVWCDLSPLPQPPAGASQQGIWYPGISWTLSQVEQGRAEVSRTVTWMWSTRELPCKAWDRISWNPGWPQACSLALPSGELWSSCCIHRHALEFRWSSITPDFEIRLYQQLLWLLVQVLGAQALESGLALEPCLDCHLWPGWTQSLHSPAVTSERWPQWDVC